MSIRLEFALRTQIIDEAWRTASNRVCGSLADPWKWLTRVSQPTHAAAALSYLCGVVAEWAGSREEQGAAHDCPLRLALQSLAGGALLWLSRLGHERETLTDAIGNERARQDAAYGALVVNYSPTDWAAALTEECGEVAQAAFRCRHSADPDRRTALFNELVQVAALAVWWMELQDLQKLRSQR